MMTMQCAMSAPAPTGKVLEGGVSVTIFSDGQLLCTLHFMPRATIGVALEGSPQRP